MDQGIIRALKAKYRSLAVRKLIAALEKKSLVPAMLILSAMMMLEKTCNGVSNKTFTNCFNKAGISEKEVEKVLNNEDDPFAGLDEIEEDTVQILEGNLVVLKDKFGNQLMLILLVIITLILTSKLLQVMGNWPTNKFLLK